MANCIRDTIMKILKPTEEKLKKLLLEKKALAEKANAIEKEKEAYDKEYEEKIKAIVEEMGGLDTKAKPRLIKLWESLQESKYQQLQRAMVNEEGELVIEVLDEEEIVVEYKNRIDEQERQQLEQSKK